MKVASNQASDYSAIMNTSATSSTPIRTFEKKEARQTGKESFGEWVKLFKQPTVPDDGIFNPSTVNHSSPVESDDAHTQTTLAADLLISERHDVFLH